MPVIINNIDQGTPEWRLLRLGVVSASRLQEIVDTKGNPSKSRTKYMRDLAGEIISGTPKKNKQYGSMAEGNEREAEAREYFELTNGVEIDQVAFVFLNELRRVGSSPDGLIGSKEGFETKNAEPHVQIGRLEDGMSRATHFQQCQGGLWICQREVWHLQSYSRNLPNVTIRYERDEKFIERLSSAVDEFIQELDYIVSKYAKAA